ncbi:hypothetical protein [Vreelandella populi]|uniref:DnaT DNA-binding domain-containing protein n=1 Tax=Vreelandella populi TaxID=2498858 RepID=A0A3S0ZGB0_9GAMM|nr:hypothetical protein [Halomonas populi]RUR48824.1 hypothetical protein ELY37_02950 [Halomonas populi]
MNSWRWNEDEDEAIDSLPIEAQIIYLRVFRKHMDYASGVVGIKRTVSYSQIKERLEYQPPVHSNEKVKEYSRGQIKRLIQKLVDAGLLERLHDTSKGVEKMIFRLPMACSDAEIARHEQDTASATQQNADETKAGDDNRDTSATREARHPSGSPVTPNPLTTFEGSPKKSRPKKWGEPVDHELVNEMVEAISVDLESPVKHSPTTWANDMRLLRERDGRSVEQIRYLIGWTAKHSFWSDKVMSPSKLREKWDQLVKQAKNEHEQKKSRLTPGRHTGLENTSTDGLVAQEDGTYEF